MFGSRRDRLEARCAAADANADAASTGDKLSRIAAIRARGSGGDSKTFRSLMPNAPGAKWSPSRKSTCGATPTTSARGRSIGLPSIQIPLEYGLMAKKRLLPMLLRYGSPLPRAAYARWMKPSSAHYKPTWCQYVAKVAAVGSWAAYEKAHIARLVPVFEKIFPRPRLPHEIASHVVRFCFHTGDY